MQNGMRKGTKATLLPNEVFDEMYWVELDDLLDGCILESELDGYTSKDGGEHISFLPNWL